MTKHKRRRSAGRKLPPEVLERAERDALGAVLGPTLADFILGRNLEGWQADARELGDRLGFAAVVLHTAAQGGDADAAREVLRDLAAPATGTSARARLLLERLP